MKPRPSTSYGLDNAVADSRGGLRGGTENPWGFSPCGVSEVARRVCVPRTACGSSHSIRAPLCIRRSTGPVLGPIRAIGHVFYVRGVPVVLSSVAPLRRRHLPRATGSVLMPPGCGREGEEDRGSRITSRHTGVTAVPAQTISSISGAKASKRQTRRASSHRQVLSRDSLFDCSNSIFSPSHLHRQPERPGAGVGSVGLLTGAASSTRLVTRITAQAEGTRQGRRGRARDAGRARRRQGSLDGQPPCGRVTRA